MARVIIASTLWLVLLVPMPAVSLAGPMLAPPFRFAQASVVVGDFRLFDGGFGFPLAGAACCGAGGGHIGARAMTSVDFGTFTNFVAVHVEDFTPPELPLIALPGDGVLATGTSSRSA